MESLKMFKVLIRHRGECNMASKVKAYHSAKAAYAAELKKFKKSLDALSASLQMVQGNGKLSDRIHWAHVGDLRYLNSFLDQAVEVKIYRVE